MMELTFLGTASAYPTPTRGVSCIIFRNTGVYWMFDCGEGSQIQLMRSAVRPGKISKIFITHLHGDHLFGLPGLLCTLSQNFTPDNKTTLEIYGPVGLRRYIRESLKLSRSQLGFNYVVHELQPLTEQYPETWQSWVVDHTDLGPLHPNEEPGTTIEADTSQVWHLCECEGMRVKAGWLRHPIPSFGFVIEEDSTPGKLDVEKLKCLGLPPGPLYAQIKQGIPVTTPDGTVICPADVLGPDRPGRKVALLGDSRDSTQMAALCQDADVLVHEATLENDLKENCLEKGHSTPGMAGQFAKFVAARHLILTHFSQRYKSAASDIKEGDNSVLHLKEQGLEAFGGEVTVADDFLVYSVPRR